MTRARAKRWIAKALQGTAVLAGVVFILVPFTASAHLAIFLTACLFVAVICGVLGGHLDDTQTGFWPDKPKK